MNVSAGRDLAAGRAIARACGPSLVDVHTDVDHQRSVFTLAGPGAHDSVGAARSLAAAVAAGVSIVAYDGVHPLLGALDVVPFVALDATEVEQRAAVAAARAFGEWWAGTRSVPVFLYDDADTAGRSLPETRRDAFRSRAPDFGPRVPHPTLGATAVGARKPLVALNLWLDTPDVAVARRIAHHVRERDGGLPGVRALGLMMTSRARAQVSMNLVDLERTGMETACRAVRERCGLEHTAVTSVEVVGLVPRRELERCSHEFLAWAGIDAGSALEARIGHGPPALPGDPEV